ncbi:MAG: GEVED domain-containing protein, partial [Bacteroidota bacterium]
ENLSDGLAITQYYDIAVAQTDANVVGGGSQDNGNVFRDENGNWRQYAPTGDGMNQEIDPTDAGTRFWAYQFGSLHRWRNGFNRFVKPPAVNYDGAWETPFKLDPSNADRLVVGYRRVYESFNQGNTWNVISGDLAGGANLNELAIAPTNGERIYVTRGATLYVKNVNNDNWVTRNLPGSISDIEVDPDDMDKVYVSVPGFSTGQKVFVSEDAGASWTNISGSLPNISVGALELFHDAPGGVFIGTDAGVFYRDDQVEDWLEYGSLPHTRVEDIEIQYAAGLIRVGTHGRGVLEAATQIIVCTESAPDEDNDGTCDTFDGCPNFDNGLIGSPCDDGDAFSSGEAFDLNCGCSGGQANLDYCAGEGSDGTGADYISFVSLNGVEHGSGQSNYSDFRSIVIPVNIGETYTLTASFNFAFDIDRFHAWADWNRDGVFSSEEYIGMSVPAGNTSTGQLMVPISTLEGATTLRVRGVYSTDFDDPCGSAFGEVEDYTLSVKCVTNCSLPVDWMGFTARGIAKQTALLEWVTANEREVQEFRVERSVNGRDFQVVQTLAARNTSNGSYEVIDEEVPVNLAYYRIAA